MNPLVVVPEAIYLTFVLVLVAAFLGSLVLILVSVICLCFVFWYARGPDTISTIEGDAADVISPCDGTVTNIYCDIQRMTHIEIAQTWTDRHVVYSIFAGEVIYMDHDAKRIVIDSNIGRIEYTIDVSARWLIQKGETVKKGDAIAFVPYEANVTVVFPVYQASINLSRNQYTTAGDIIGKADQIWSL